MSLLSTLMGRVSLFTLLISLQIPIAKAQTLILNDANGPPYTTLGRDGFLDVVGEKIFKQAGVDVKLIRTPAERGLRNANEGIDDGEITRIEGIDKVYTNLIRVPEKIVDMDFVAFSKMDLQLQGWDSLRNHNLGFILGWKIFEAHTNGFQYVQSVRNSDILFSMLAKDRIDVALYSRWVGLSILKEKKLKGIHVLEPALATREMFIYLNKKHSVLVPKITDALREIKQSGEYERLFKEKVINSVIQ